MTQPWGLRAVRAAYWAFIVSVPLETVLYFKELKDDGGRSGVTISRILGIVVFGLALANWKACFQTIPRAFWGLAWYVAAYSLSQLWVPQALDGRFMEHQMTMIQMAALFLVSVNLFENEDYRERVLGAYGWAVTLVAAATLTGLLGDTDLEKGRNTLAGQDPNLTAALFAVGALTLVAQSNLLTPPGAVLRLPLTLGAVAVLTLGILDTGSRGGLLALVAGITGLAVCGGERTRRARPLIVLVMVGLLGVLLAQEFKGNTNTANRLERAWTEGDTTGRTGIYDAAWNMFLDKPLMGHGGVNNRFTLGAQLNKDFLEAHNMFLSVLTEVGLIGALPLILSFFYVLWGAWRARAAVAFAPLCALLVMNVSVTGTREKVFWVILAAAAAGWRRSGRAA